MNANAKAQAGLERAAQLASVSGQMAGTMKLPEKQSQTSLGDVDAVNSGPAPDPRQPPSDSEMYVIDTTARPENVAGRTHDMVVNGLVKPFTFHYGKPLLMPKVVAQKFLKHQEFKLVDADGRILAYDRAPKQPEEMGAGEAFHLGESETIARFSELSTVALQNRCIASIGGEKFATSTNRDGMVEFLAAAKPKVQKLIPRNADAETDLLVEDDDDDMPAGLRAHGLRTPRYRSDGFVANEE